VEEPERVVLDDGAPPCGRVLIKDTPLYMVGLCYKYAGRGRDSGISANREIVTRVKGQGCIPAGLLTVHR
jgi:hypothetical protein